jgi:uncharacterized protein YdiU (UPF0061 family)
MLDYTTEMFYPEIHESHKDRIARTLAFFKEVAMRTAHLVALWQCVGFCHGVLNTDNMSIVGVTIDYGPFGFLNRYDPDHICNKSDNNSRYVYAQQKSVCKWNLKKLSEALSPCLPREEAEVILKLYDEEFEKAFLLKMRHKLGLIRTEDDQDGSLVEDFLEAMHITGCDFTNGFRLLNKMPLPQSEEDQSGLEDTLLALLDQCCTPQEMLASMPPSMHQHNLRMMLSVAEQTPQLLSVLGISLESLKKEQEKQEARERLKNTSPQDKRSNDEVLWRTWLAKYKKRLLKEAKELGDKSALDKANVERVTAMNEYNPKFVLRNHIAQKAIELSEEGDYSEVERILFLLKHPYDEVVEIPLKSDKGSHQVLTDDKVQKLDSCSPCGTEVTNYYSRPSLDGLQIAVT